MKYKVIYNILLLFTIITFSTCNRLIHNEKVASIKESVDSTKEDINPIIDPIEIRCYDLYPDKVKDYCQNTEYIGRVTFETKLDTTKLILKDFKIMFAKLRSRTNPLDTIEIRMQNHVGNYKYIEDLTPKLIEHLSYIKLRKTNYENCTTTCGFYIGLKIK